MANKKISFNTDPHIAEVGPYRLEFRPEVYGDEFLDAYNRLQAAQKKVSDGEAANLTGEQLRSLYAEIRGFLADLMTPEGKAEFNRFEVVPASGGERLGPYLTEEEAEEAALSVEGGATVENKSIRLPNRVLMELMEWLMEIYGGGGGGGNRPTGSSNASARASSTGGTPGRGNSRSRA